MRPAGLVAVCNEIVHGARTQIVECGSGVSTVLLARLLRERRAGGLVALEHDRHWAGVGARSAQARVPGTRSSACSTRRWTASRRGTHLRGCTRSRTPSTCLSSTARQPSIPVTARAANRHSPASMGASSTAPQSSSTTWTALANAKSSQAGKGQLTGGSSWTRGPASPSAAAEHEPFRSRQKRRLLGETPGTIRSDTTPARSPCQTPGSRNAGIEAGAASPMLHRRHWSSQRLALRTSASTRSLAARAASIRA